jgi:hypothetical protein
MQPWPVEISGCFYVQEVIYNMLHQLNNMKNIQHMTAAKKE